MAVFATKLLGTVAAAALAGLAVFSYDQAHRLQTTSGAEAQTAAVQTAPAKGGSVNACALLSDEDVSSIVGVKVTKGERRDDGEVGGKGDYAPLGTYSSTCFWQFSADAVGDTDPTLPMGGKRFAILNVMSWPSGGEDAAKFLQSFRDAFKHDIIPNDPVSVDIGDEGIWWGDGVAARKANKSFGVSVFLQNGDKATQRKMEESLARKVVGRL